MARARNIKPGFYRDAALVELPVEARLLFPGLWMLADRAGRLEDRPKQIKMEIFPADSFDVDMLLGNLADAGLIVRYKAEGVGYIQVVNFEKHQNPHRDEKASTIPAPCEQRESTVLAQCNDGANPADSLIPDSLNPESTPAQGKPARFDPLSLEMPEGVTSEKWREWIDYRKFRHLPTTEPTARKQLEFLTKCHARGQPASAIIDASIMSGWQGLFELKGNGNGKNGSSRAERISATIAELTGANRDPSRVIDGVAARVD